IPFTDSQYSQTTEIHLQEQSYLKYWDVLSAGRVKSGESWKFKFLELETKLFIEGKLDFLERFRLEPEFQTPAIPFAMSDYSYLITGLFHSPASSSDELESMHHFILNHQDSFAAIDSPT